MDDRMRVYMRTCVLCVVYVFVLCQAAYGRMYVCLCVCVCVCVHIYACVYMNTCEQVIAGMHIYSR
jgi:hypothetical protein